MTKLDSLARWVVFHLFFPVADNRIQGAAHYTVKTGSVVRVSKSRPRKSLYQNASCLDMCLTNCRASGILIQPDIPVVSI